MGIYRRCWGGYDDHPGEMAVKASKSVLQKTGVDPLEIDLILYAGETYAEYTCWTVGIYIQQQIGATVDSCYAFDLSFRCAGTPLGLKIAKEVMYADPSLRTVLVAAGNANCNIVNLKDPTHSFMFNMAPAGLRPKPHPRIGNRDRSDLRDDRGGHARGDAKPPHDGKGPRHSGQSEAPR
jgi:3-oxoacyl-[acyl-carrier-protein] synthase-3